MKFLIATHSVLGIATIQDFELKNFYVLDRDFYYGSIILEDGTIISCKRSLSQSKRSPTVLRAYPKHELEEVFQLSHMADECLDMHQLSINSSSLYFTGTATNEIFTLGRSGGVRKYGFSEFGGWADFNHINSIFTGDDKIYLVFHNRGVKPSEIKIFDHDFNEIESHRLQHSSIHNIEVESDADTFYYNASNDGAVVRSRFTTGEPELAVVGTEWHPKGLCMAGAFVISGYSEHAVSTPRRFVSESGLAFIDRESWKVAATTPLRVDGDFIGNINEIRCIES